MKNAVNTNLSAELVSIGTELLLGEITDTNSVYMARVLRDQGINVFYMISVGDNKQRIADVIRTSLSRTDIVITCGGLGPTVDDVTRDAIATATDRELVFQQDLLDRIVERFASYGVEMTENNRRQAYIPAEAIAIANPVGTAPAFIVEVGEKCVISLPGVPREMKFLIQQQVVPYLRERYGITEQVILARLLKTAGIGESRLDTLIGGDILTAANPTVGLAAHSGQIDIRVTAKADTHKQAEMLINDMEARIRERVDGHIFGIDEDTLEDALADLLEQHNATLAISETGTGDIIQGRLDPVLGKRSLIVKATGYKAVDQLAAEMANDTDDLQDLACTAAKSLLSETGCTVSIAVVSRANADENPDKNTGTAVVVCTADACRHRVYGFGGQNENTQRFVGNWSTAIAWRLIKDLFDDA